MKPSHSAQLVAAIPAAAVIVVAIVVAVALGSTWFLPIVAVIVLALQFFVVRPLVARRAKVSINSRQR